MTDTRRDDGHTLADAFRDDRTEEQVRRSNERYRSYPRVRCARRSCGHEYHLKFGRTPWCIVCGSTKATLIGTPCRHQDASGRYDCVELAVLCEIHGGHDACATDLMNATRSLAVTEENVRRVADEIERLASVEEAGYEEQARAVLLMLRGEKP